MQKARTIEQAYARLAGIRDPAYRERSGVELTGPGGGAIQTEAIVQIYIPGNGREREIK